MENLSFKVRVIWIWAKLTGENKYFSIQAKSLDDVCYQNKLLIKENHILRVKLSTKSLEEIQRFREIFLNPTIEVTVDSDFALIEADGYSIKQFTANSITCALSTD